MGEAKRRKQALGDRYGEIPPVLMPGSEQLEENEEKFAEAYFLQLKQMPKAFIDLLFSSFAMEVNEEQVSEYTNGLEEMKSWSMNYLQSYRVKDREKLALHLVEVAVVNLANQEKIVEDQSVEAENLWASTVMFLFCLNSLNAFLSQERQKYFRVLAYDIFRQIQRDIEFDGRLKPKEKGQELKWLKQLLMSELDIESIPA